MSTDTIQYIALALAFVGLISIVPATSFIRERYFNDGVEFILDEGQSVFSEFLCGGSSVSGNLGLLLCGVQIVNHTPKTKTIKWWSLSILSMAYRILRILIH